MTPERLRGALAGHPISRLDVDALRGGYLGSPGALREAAVLVPVYFHPDGAAHVLMTRRRNDLRLTPGRSPGRAAGSTPATPIPGPRRCARRTRRSGSPRITSRWWGG